MSPFKGTSGAEGLQNQFFETNWKPLKFWLVQITRNNYFWNLK